MSLNLKTMADHPVQVLLRTPGVEVGTFTTAATRLSEFEQEKGLTFAALDNDALAAVREAYAAFDGEGQKHAVDRIALSAEFQRAVRDLLGLDD